VLRDKKLTRESLALSKEREQMELDRENWECSTTCLHDICATCLRRTFSKAATAGRRRQLLGASLGATAGSLASSSNQYTGQTAAQSGRRAMIGGVLGDEAAAAQPSRYVGPAPSRNKIIGGLFLHTTHKSPRSTCPGESPPSWPPAVLIKRCCDCGWKRCARHRAASPMPVLGSL